MPPTFTILHDIQVNSDSGAAESSAGNIQRGMIHALFGTELGHAWHQSVYTKLKKRTTSSRRQVIENRCLSMNDHDHPWSFKIFDSCRSY